MIEKKYYAFISYKREDEEWAQWLQHKLEHYKLPANLNGRTDLPKEIRPVFKDTSELNPGNLPQQIHDALEQSRYLIVICSPRSAKSEWVNREVETFIEMGGTERIIPFIIEGTAFSKDPDTECFPLALRKLPSEQEILGANINEMGRDAAAVKVIAQMFGLRFDELWQRYRREQRKKRRWIIASCIAGFLVMTGVALWIWSQNVEIKRQNTEIKEKDWETMENQARAVVEKAMTIAETDSYSARIIALDVLPSDLNNPDKPYTNEAEALLRKANLHNTAILKKDNQHIIAATFSPNGEQIVTLSDKVIFWDANTGDEIEELSEIGSPRTIAYSPDGKCILVSSYYLYLGFRIELYNINTYNKELSIESEENTDINDVALSPDGNIIAYATDFEVVFWDTHEDAMLNRLDYNGVLSIAFSPSGKQIVFGMEDNSVKILDIETQKEAWAWKGNDQVRSVAFSPDEKLLASASRNGIIKILKIGEETELHTLKGHTACVNEVSFSPDGKHVVSASDDRTVRVWDTESGNEIRILEGHTGEVESATFSPDGKRIISASLDGSAMIWDWIPDSGLRSFKAHPASVNSIAFSPNGKNIASASADNKIRIWDVETGNELRTFDGHTDEVNFLAFSSDGQRIVSTSSDGTNKIWSVEKGLELEIPIAELEPFHFPVVFSQDGNFILQAAYGGIVNTWNSETGDPVGEIDIADPGLEVYFTTATFSLDRKKFALIENCPRIGAFVVSIIDVTSGDFEQSIEGTTNFRSVDFSPDGTNIVTSSRDHLVKIWEVETGAWIRTIEGHNANVLFAKYSPNGEYIVSGSDDYTIRVWDEATGAELLMWEEKSHDFRTLAISPNSRKIAVGFTDGTITIIDFPPLQELIDQTRERFKDRPLTEEERRMYYLE